LPLDIHQQHEMFLTSAQSLFAIVLLADFAIVWWEAGLLFVLFTGQMVAPMIFPAPAVNEAVRLWCGYLYILLALVFVVTSRERRQGLSGAFRQFLACSGVSLRRSHKP
jgi:cation:H+ antiporter